MSYAITSYKCRCANMITGIYALVTNYATPTLMYKDEILGKVTAIGLNPTYWKGP
ncbi:hypothetical protein BJX64DRAFT_267022 [Aspergillus heterothallicus]